MTIVMHHAAVLITGTSTERGTLGTSGLEEGARFWETDTSRLYRWIGGAWVETAGGGGGTPSDTVVSETAFGQSSLAGTASTYSRGDHTHGTPADPVPAHAALPNAHHTAFTQSDHDGLPNPHHSNANDPTSDQKAALAGTSGSPSGTNKYVTNDDARNTNARTPTSHSHPQSDVTDLVTDLGNKVVIAGQLGGTPSSPDVRGLRETGGPTLLTLGAIAEGQMLVRSGATIVGQTGGGGGLSHQEVMIRVSLGY